MEKHFDEEGRLTESAIDSLIAKIKHEIEQVNGCFSVDPAAFYVEFRSSVDSMLTDFNKFSQLYISASEMLITILEKKKSLLTTTLTFSIPEDFSEPLTAIFTQYARVRVNAQEYTKKLSATITQAKESLRLREVYDFVHNIAYQETEEHIKNLEDEKRAKEGAVQRLDERIRTLQTEIADKKRLLRDEEKGAKKINEYLSNYFGQGLLSLQAVEKSNADRKSIYFMVVRDGKKAYHLSEGESHLISFCYFMAKLNDIETSGLKPIIWIDDPISSLDANHVFFVYSLIEAEIAQRERYEQLFISTHSLEFLKYLRRLPLSKKSGEKRFFIITRHFDESQLSCMPNYLKNHSTEFNYLFGEVYKCSSIDEVNDENYASLYSFGNNARRFLELYLFYRYPDDTSQKDKLIRFFGEGQIPPIVVEKINDEGSHPSGAMEISSLPAEMGENVKSAQLIIEKLKSESPEQFAALLTSVGIS